MTWSASLRQALDVLVPEERSSAARRVRNTALWAALSAWLLPAYPALGTDATPQRAWICGAFIVVAGAAHLADRGRRWMQAFAAATLVAGALVGVFGGRWGFGFVVFAACVMGATAARRRFVAFPPVLDEPDRLPPRPGGVPRFLAFYAWLGVSVLFMTQWAAQAMVVPTGSMQPTIMGAAGRPRESGDHLLVENFSYLFRDPKRWEIVVFQFPLFRGRYFVKRVIGLPGEHVEIKDGDVWIDGKIAAKPPVVQATMWRELFPRPEPGARPRTIAEGFQATGPWKPQPPLTMTASPGAAETTFAKCVAKDPAAQRGEKTCADLRVAFTATPLAAGASALARITSRGTVVTLTVPASGEGSLDVGGARSTSSGSLGAGARVELCVADGAAWAVVAGREVARADVPVAGRGDNVVEIGAAGGGVSFTDPWVGQDVRYDRGGGPAAYDVPKDGFFFLGDNVRNSADSRAWTAEVFRPAGSAPPIFARLRLIDEMGNDERASNVRIEDGKYRFVDADGVARELPVAGTARESGVPAPFATRGHLVGRAVMIFWPFSTADAGFRPRLLP